MKEAHADLLRILQSELRPALGCTEPSAIALASARARRALGLLPEHMEVACSANVIKNVMGVAVPNSGGMRGIEAAALLGMVGGNADSGLCVLESITAEHVESCRRLLGTGNCRTLVLEGDECLRIRVAVTAQGHEAVAEITNRHDCLSLLEVDGRDVLQGERSVASVPGAITGVKGNPTALSIRSILEFAETVPIDEVREMLDMQVELNSAIADEGLRNSWGANVGSTLLEAMGQDVRIRARARAAAGSDARMGGCAMPVVVSGGSGNQGLTLSLPVIEFAKELGVGHERLMRALVISNLVSIRQKTEIGRLSAYCGAVSAAAGCGAAIAWLHGLDYDGVAGTLTNTLANIGGMVCDGAKASCAAKISSAVDAAVLGFEMSRRSRRFAAGEGLVGEDVEKTISNFGRLARIGMKSTDVEILKIMIGQT